MLFLSLPYPSKFNEWIEERPKVSYNEQMGAHILHTAFDLGVCQQTDKSTHYDYDSLP